MGDANGVAASFRELVAYLRILFYFGLFGRHTINKAAVLFEVLTGIADEVVRQAGSKPQGWTV